MIDFFFWNSILLDVSWMINFDINIHHGLWKFWNSLPLNAHWITFFLIKYIFTMVEEKFEIPYPRCALNDKFWWYSSSPWLKKFWSSVPLDTPWMTNFDKIHLHYDWREIGNSTLLDAPWMTSFNINLHWLKKILKFNNLRCI